MAKRAGQTVTICVLRVPQTDNLVVWEAVLYLFIIVRSSLPWVTNARRLDGWCRSRCMFTHVWALMFAVRKISRESRRRPLRKGRETITRRFLALQVACICRTICNTSMTRATSVCELVLSIIGKCTTFVTTCDTVRSTRSAKQVTSIYGPRTTRLCHENVMDK